jgi:DNA-binding beta-propeller fold protein YncE
MKRVLPAAHVWITGLSCVALAGVQTGCGSSSGATSGTPAAQNATSVSADGGFGSYGKGAGQLYEPNGLAVNQQTGDIYVVDSNNARIDRFSSTGRFQYAWGWGIAQPAKPLIPQRCSTHCNLGIEGPGVGQFQFPEGIAIDNNPSSPSRGDIYVVDIGNHRIQKFDQSGRFLLMIGNGVNDVTRAQGYPTLEDRCPANLGDICGPGSEAPSKGPAAGQLEFNVEGDFIAVGPKGTLYVGQTNTVKEYTPQGIYKTQIKLTPNPQPGDGREAGGVSALAVDTNGNIYTVRHGVKGIHEYTPTGKPIRTLEPNTPPATPEHTTPAIILDTNNNLYIDILTTTNHHRINMYNPNGHKTATLDNGQEDGLHGLTYNPQTKKLYITNINNNNKPYKAHIRTLTPPNN